MARDRSIVHPRTRGAWRVCGRDSIVRCRLSRLAAELNLSRIPDKFADERAERESHNRTRMWLMCFIMDRCLSIQSGKAWMVQEDAVSESSCLCVPRLLTALSRRSGTRCRG